jgi:hypothetical protein
MSPASPQPSFDQTQPRRDEKGEKEDLFATLFSPPTPPASPLPISTSDDTAATTSTKHEQYTHPRSFSTSSSEFGSFVSVPVTEDPLYADKQAVFSSISPINHLQFFDQFTDHANKSNAQKRQVLDELLLHQDDPLYWLNDANESTPPDLDIFETDDTKQALHSQIPPILEESYPQDLQGREILSDRYASHPSKLNVA